MSPEQAFDGNMEKGDAMNNEQKSQDLALEMRSRVEQSKGDGEFKEVRRTVHRDPKKTAIIICDMWNDHTCKGAANRVAEMAPAMNQMVKAARAKGMLIIYAPSGTTSLYEDTSQRRQAIQAPFAKAPVEIKWNNWDNDREGEPLTFMSSGGCGCAEPCPGWVPDENGIRQWKGEKVPWTRQIETIEIAAEDAISDNGQEIYNLMQERGINNVILMGVHTNICVSGRPFGIRQMVFFGKSVALCRDLTDALFQSKSPDFSHFRGTDLVVEHIEKHLCPSITSTAITGEPEFRFKGSSPA